MSRREILEGLGYSEVQIKFILDKLEETYLDWNRYEYADNLRIARQSVDEEVQEYYDLKRRGCCGYYDKEFQVDGDTIMIGFNYGH